jgi:hypothetical protein
MSKFPFDDDVRHWQKKADANECLSGESITSAYSSTGFAADAGLPFT